MSGMWEVALLICLTGQARAAWWEELRDFTKSPTEHQIVFVDRVFVVRSVKGVIAFQDVPGETLRNVLFEIEGPGTVRRIRRTTSDDNGLFKMAHVPAGTYKFKATRDGFSSMVGSITVAKKAPKDSTIRIQMAVGH